ncbi:hypothetical protein ARMGADRAFT_1011555 [Armillaria gallica]|uniref:Uncharacterized protein n=1 Tax=Armillaria gallica TaxID=47427 RepID=A0A2H3DHD0_ARMGA|nr:hypothetical protein ARMGADRAFT_1011555 [Armillaria gallica]
MSSSMDPDSNTIPLVLTTLRSNESFFPSSHAWSVGLGGIILIAAQTVQFFMQFAQKRVTEL